MLSHNVFYNNSKQPIPFHRERVDHTGVRKVRAVKSARTDSPLPRRRLKPAGTVYLVALSACGPRSVPARALVPCSHTGVLLELLAAGGGLVRRCGASEIMGNGRGGVSMRVENKWRNAMEWRCAALVGAQARPRVGAISHG